MAKIKNRTNIYAVMRKDVDLGRDVVCCFAGNLVKAEDLCGEYEQQYADSGGDPEVSYFYVVANTYYDQ